MQNDQVNYGVRVSDTQQNNYRTGSVKVQADEFNPAVRSNVQYDVPATPMTNVHANAGRVDVGQPMIRGSTVPAQQQNIELSGVHPSNTVMQGQMYSDNRGSVTYDVDRSPVAFRDGSVDMRVSGGFRNQSGSLNRSRRGTLTREQQIAQFRTAAQIPFSILLRNFRGFSNNMDPSKLDNLWMAMDRNGNNFLERNESKLFFDQCCFALNGGDSLSGTDKD